jgi:hypothetical protein
MDHYNSLSVAQEKLNEWLSLSDNWWGVATTNDVIWVPPTLNVHTYSVQLTNELVSVASEKFKNNPNIKVVFAWISEAFPTDLIYFMNRVLKILIEEHGMTFDSFYYQTSANYCERNIKHYHELISLFPYLPRILLFNNQWEYMQACQTREAPRLVHNPGPEREKKFLCLNGQPRPHRKVLLAQLEYKNLFDQGHVSAVFHFHNDPWEPIIEKLFPNIGEGSIQVLNSMRPRFPINLTLGSDNMHQLSVDDFYLYQSSLFSVVAETLFTDDLNLLLKDKTYQNTMLSFPSTFTTEKIWKPIRAEHPFIALTTPYFLEHFRELGYKTFHPYINESYDLIEDPELRLIAVVQEIDRLCHMSDTETVKWLSKVQSITKFNFEKLNRTELIINEERF